MTYCLSHKLLILPPQATRHGWRRPSLGLISPGRGRSWARGQYSGLEPCSAQPRPSLIRLCPPGHRPYINDLVQADIALKILISLPSLVFVSSWFPHTIACQPLTQLHLISLQVCHTIWHSYQWLNLMKCSSVCKLGVLDTFDHWLRKWFIRFPWACYVIY